MLNRLKEVTHPLGNNAEFPKGLEAAVPTFLNKTAKMFSFLA